MAMTPLKTNFVSWNGTKEFPTKGSYIRIQNKPYIITNVTRLYGNVYGVDTPIGVYIVNAPKQKVSISKEDKNTFIAFSNVFPKKGARLCLDILLPDTVFSHTTGELHTQTLITSPIKNVSNLFKSIYLCTTYSDLRCIILVTK